MLYHLTASHLQYCFISQSWALPLKRELPIPALSHPWKPPVLFLCLWLWVFQVPPVSGRTQYLPFFRSGLFHFSRMSSRFIHVVAYIIIVFLRVNNNLLCGWTTFYLHICWWTLELFLSSSCCEGAAVNIGRQVYLCLSPCFPFLRGIYQKVELLDYI